MALTAAEKKKMARIEKELKDRQQMLESIKAKAANDFAKVAMKYGLYQLDNSVMESELKLLAEKHNTL